ncbi:MAG TPA: asparagine synthase (glutamine-hydrolyzing) [Stellaceae bacterium]|nr:asparagine synthase (glutamine-hydrolyzing) [Stellaceae bacterium]
MCGIAGFLASPDAWPGKDRAQDIVVAMRDALAHRGPDDRGAWLDEEAGIAFGFRRLSIIDLSEHGHQPMMSACGRYAMVYNGEIYNFRDLRRKAEAWGHSPWRGHSDSEVILALISKWGVAEAVKALSGMFAIAVWDREEQSLWLVRDRFGEKPLYYGRQRDHFVFGSELKALRAHPGFEGRLSAQAISEFLRHGFIADPLTIHENLWKLPPGHILYLKPRSEPRVWPYWDAVSALTECRANPFEGSAEEAAEELDRRIRAVTAERMISDVPLGAFLSGGIDSSTVVAAMMASGNRPVKTYTVGFPGTRFDEAPHAEAIAKHLGSDHTTFTLSEADLRSVVPDLGRIYDEPFADPSQIPTALLCRETRKHVTVALSGDGGDEMFGGYPRYRDIPARWASLQGYPSAMRRGLFLLLRALRGRDGRPQRRLRKMLAELGAPGAEALYRDRMSRWRPDEGLTVPVGGVDTEWDRLIPEPSAGLSPARHFMLRDILTYLPADLLVKVDRASMAFGLEVRAPLLDHELAGFIWSLPDTLTVEGEGKALLRKVLARHVPPALFERPKQGFEPPLADWLRHDLRRWAEDLIGRHGEHYNSALARRRWQEHVSGRRNWTYALWTVLMLESWLGHQAPGFRH